MSEGLSAALVLAAALAAGGASERVRLKLAARAELRERFARTANGPRPPGHRQRSPRGELLRGELVRIGLAGWHAPLALAFALAAGGLGCLWLGPLGLLAPLALLALGGRWIRARILRRRVVISAQLPTFLGHLAGACEAGCSLPKAFDTALRDADDPLREVFVRRIGQLRRGEDLETALIEAATQYPVSEYHVGVFPIYLHHHHGRNLASLLRCASAALRERERSVREQQQQRAQSRRLSWVLGFLPALFWIGVVVTGPHALPSERGAATWLALLAWSSQVAGLAALWRIAHRGQG